MSKIGNHLPVLALWSATGKDEIVQILNVQQETYTVKYPNGYIEVLPIIALVR
mgnify:CR=1 FL=1